ncbi:alpha/beta fold hydrolase [Humitalea sp. 24SJ18S-53]|uniref:alpha/beta fold hydrolase n=1 Tax=Humitalea sp. 24SJ18S-53 TaxID=3422307 RepID=UPI003D663F8C
MNPRRGPRPLPLHLTLSAMRRMLALGAIPPSLPGLPPWSDAWPISKAGRAERDRILAAAAALQSGPGDPSPPADPTALLRAAVIDRLGAEDAAFQAGVLAYRRHPAQRDLPDPPVLWREGSARLLDYGGSGPAMLFVPSLVNRAHVLDLAPGHSLLRWMAGQGARPLLLDWGFPGAAECGFSLTDHIAGRLERALLACGGPVIMVGYCMGGLLALASALRRPDRVVALALLATPWDFHAGPGAAAQAPALAAMLPGLEPVMELTGGLPTDMVQALFAGLDPWGIARKFRRFATMDQDSARARQFVALEDWLNDGVPLPAPVARECFTAWYGRNDTARLAWRVAGQVVDPADWAGPLFIAVPRADRIVPPASAMGLADRAAKGAARITLHDAAAGHIGMATGPLAESALWRPLRDWALVSSAADAG